MPGSPCLSKKRRIKCAVRSFLKIYLGDYLACLSLAPCLVAARAVRWRPCLAGMRQYILFIYIYFNVFIFCRSNLDELDKITGQLKQRLTFPGSTGQTQADRTASQEQV